MDLVFKRYSSPFLFLDMLIENGKFLEFVLEFIDNYNEEHIYELWLHKCFDKAYQDFKNEIMGNNDVQETQAELNDDDITAIINDSYSLLNNFKPC